MNKGNITTHLDLKELKSEKCLEEISVALGELSEGEYFLEQIIPEESSPVQTENFDGWSSNSTYNVSNSNYYYQFMCKFRPCFLLNLFIVIE